MRRVLFVTGIRSEYDILHSVVQATRAAGMQPELVVTGAHLSPTYGYTAREVEADGERIVARLETLLNSDTKAARVKSAAIQLMGLVDVLANSRPDFLIAPFDREEAVTVALAGAYLRIPVVHIGGGDTAEDGNVDNAVRHAVTKLSHLHMVTTPRSAARVQQLGEDPWRVHVVGAPGLDRLLSEPEVSDAEIWSRLGFEPDGPFAILIQHAIISSVEESGELMRTTMAVLAELRIPTFVSYPNTDSGSHLIIEVIERFASDHSDLFCVYHSLPRSTFVNLMRRAHVMVGNSSSGIIESALFGLPVVNIGPRQRGREHSANVQFVDHDPAEIRKAVERAVRDEPYRRTVAQTTNVYGDGTAGPRIAQILATVPLDERLLQKVNTF